MKSQECVELTVGYEVRYKDFNGFVKFICEDYATICINNFEDKVRQVCLVVPKSEWDNLKLYKESEK